MAKKEVNKKETKKTNKAEKNKKTFFKSFKTELKKVVWPTPKQLVNNTVTVITLVLIVAAIVFALDFVFEIMNKQGINRVRDMFVTTEDANATADSNTTEDSSSTESNSSEGTEIEVTNTEASPEATVEASAETTSEDQAAQ